MNETINWLHLADIHCGLDDSSWIWPKIKNDLFKDIEILGDKHGGWDLVFFTGDFTQQAKEEEFDKLNRDLEELWVILSKSGKKPLLCPVPGNHDLVRPNKGDAIAKTLTQLWWVDPDLRRRFWKEPEGEYGTAIKEYFSHYTNWVSKLDLPKIEMNAGILPGDFSGTFSKGKIKLGIIGLNSTFLQIIDGEFRGKLDMHVAQLNSVCSEDPPQWLKGRTASLLLTHQPPSCLAADGLEHFRQEIYPPGRFLVQLCGHQHEPEAFEVREAGAPPRRLRQAPSFFGLENWGGDKPRRIHGYTAGQFFFEESGGIETLWPRMSVMGRHGALKISPDVTYDLQEGNCIVTHFDLDIDERARAVSGSDEDSTSIKRVSENRPELPNIDLRLLEGLPDEEEVIARLAHCPRLNLNIGGPQNRYVRQQEQSEFESELRKRRCVWLTADWGTGAEEFLASSLERFRTQEFSPDIFHLRCDDAFDIDRLESLFPQQFSMPFQAFFTLVTRLKYSFLVFDGINPELCKGEHAGRLTRLTHAIIDYCPELRLVFVSRLRPEFHEFSIVELRPLEMPDVRTYLTHHPDATPDLQEPDIVENLYEHSDGLPMHLDRFIRALKVSSLASVLETDMEGLPPTIGISEKTPIALIHAVSIIANSNDKLNKRSFRLMKVLSVLPYGETLETLHHYLPTEPFFYENALQLSELALLDVIPLQQTIPHVGMGGQRLDGHGAPKILKVPRQIRDYVLTLLTEEEKNEIVFAGIDKCFGQSWRDGKVKLRTLPLEYREYLNSGTGNEFSLIHYLINHGRTNNDVFMVKCGALLGIKYSEHLNNADRYRDLTTVAGALVQTLDYAEYPNEWSKLSVLYGKGLRMTRKREEAVKYLKAVLDAGNVILSKDEKATVWLNIALAEEGNNNEGEAVAAAKEVRKYVERGSGQDLQAQTIIAESTPNKLEKKKKLIRIEKEARSKSYLTAANNISLDLAQKEITSSGKIRLLDKVLKSKEQGYNNVRALVAKAETIEEMDGGGTLTTSEFLSLTLSYSYLHAQRFGSLFDRCHQVLWKIYESNGDTRQLLRLFRHTSFLWRIRGEEAKEAKYLRRLSEKNVEETQSPEKSEIILEFRYFTLRVHAVLRK